MVGGSHNDRFPVRQPPYCTCGVPSSAPVAALLVNSCAIAIRSMLSKYVAPDELGKFLSSFSFKLSSVTVLMSLISLLLYCQIIILIKLGTMILRLKEHILLHELIFYDELTDIF